jgi:hypothetical protein
MPTPTSARSLHALLAALPLALVACDSGPSETEFAAACVQEGQRGINKAMSREMGIDRGSFCRCTAREAKAVASPDGYRWMMLDMAGKRQDAAALHAKLSEEERMAVAKAGLTVLGKCLGGKG